MELFQGIDWGAYYHFQAKRMEWLDCLLGPGVLFAKEGCVVLLGASVILLAFVHKSVTSAGWMSLVAAAGWAGVELTRRGVGRERPDVAAALVNDAEFVLSFPSQGVFLTTLGLSLLAFALEAWCRQPRQLILVHGVALALIGYVAFGQLVFGLHYVTDVVAGLIVGCAIALLCRLVISKKESVAL